jgi:hypothetical protein
MDVRYGLAAIPRFREGRLFETRASFDKLRSALLRMRLQFVDALESSQCGHLAGGMAICNDTPGYARGFSQARPGAGEAVKPDRDQVG